MDLTKQIMRTVDNMIDPNATLEQQLAQMRAQLTALSQLPNLIQQKVEAVNRQISQMSQMQSYKEVRQEKYVEIERPKEKIIPINKYPEDSQVEITEIESDVQTPSEKQLEIRVTKPSLTEAELACLRNNEVRSNLEDKIQNKKEEIFHPIKVEQPQKPQERSKPEPAFGPVPQERTIVLPGSKKWKKTQEYDEDLIQETLTAQAEVIKGRAIGVNFMKYQKPPPALDHLKNSEVYKAIHNKDEQPLKKVEMLRPVIAEADYRERARSMSPCPNGR